MLAANNHIEKDNPADLKHNAGEPLCIIKIGGNIIDHEEKLAEFLKSFSAIKGKKILVHGGGKLATRMAEQLGIQQQMVDGRRITDADTLRIVTMVYAGFINKTIVAKLKSYGCLSMGLSGADGNLLLAHKRRHPSIDFGYVGDIDKVNAELLQTLLEAGMTIIVAPITHDGNGTLLNTNADTIAQEIAAAMSQKYTTSLVYSFEKNGVLLDVADPDSVISRITPSYYTALKTKKVISEGMLPKLDNAFKALDTGVSRVIIGNAEALPELLAGQKGTNITHE